MKSEIEDFLLHCNTIDFGRGKLSKPEDIFYRRFSKGMVSLCRSMPESTQPSSVVFLMQYAGVNLGDKLDFFAHYYQPTWSILYWLSHEHALPTKRLDGSDVTNAVTAQSMAMFLHSLDDHLTDGQVSVSPLTLLLRSQAWTIMNRAFCELAEGVPEGEKIVRSFVDDYYLSIQDSQGPKSLDEYCEFFRKQMAIGMVAPILLSLKMTGISDFTRDLEIAYGSFGIAWRLLDDVRDIGDDIEKGVHSSIYFCLPEQVMALWNSNTSGRRSADRDCRNVILNHIREHTLIDILRERICTELDAAASIVESHNMAGFAREFRCLAHPLRNRNNTLELANGRH